MRILMLPRYGPLGASSRLRTWQYVSYLTHSGLSVTLSPFFDDHLLKKRYESGGYSVFDLFSAYCKRLWALLSVREYDLVWIEKESLPWLPAWLERVLLWRAKYALDFDDAIFHNYDHHPLFFVRLLLGRKLDSLMRSSCLVVAGNQYLAKRAQMAGAENIAIQPTVVNLDRYNLNDKKVHGNDLPCIVWIGSPSTVRYLNLLKIPLLSLAERVDFKLLVIGGVVDMPGLNVECRLWDEGSEVANICSGDIGVMPLVNSPWELGKCGYKLIQYMACGLPVVASPVGVNIQMITEGSNGFLARDNQEWITHLEFLLNTPSACLTMGANGRRLVETDYSLSRSKETLTSILENTVSH